MKILIDMAANTLVNDIITIAIHNEEAERGIHLIGRILSINDQPHPDIIKFTVKLFAHCDHVCSERYTIGMRPERKIAIIRD